MPEIEKGADTETPSADVMVFRPDENVIPAAESTTVSPPRAHGSVLPVTEIPPAPPIVTGKQ